MIQGKAQTVWLPFPYTEQNWHAVSLYEFAADTYEEGIVVTYLPIKSQKAEA